MHAVPRDAAGRTMHLGVAAGDVAARILSVGDEARAARIAVLLSPPAGAAAVRVTRSSRGFTTYLGVFRGVDISIVVTGMGCAMMDFVVRETRAVVEGPMAIVRLGTCGALDAALEPGSVALVSGSVLVRRCPDAAAARARGAADAPALTLAEDGGAPSLAPTAALPYAVSGVVRPSAALTAAVRDALKGAVRGGARPALDATADSFYASQGRASGLPDRNEALLPALAAAGVGCLQMESFHLLDMARASGGALAAAAAHIVVFNRATTAAATPAEVAAREAAAGRAVLSALAAYAL